MADKWIQGAIKKPGSFTKQAEKHGETAKEFATQVKANPEKYSETTEKRANLAATLGHMSKEHESHDKEHEHEREERHEEEREHPGEHERKLEGKKEGEKEKEEHEREGQEKRHHGPMADWLKEPRRARKEKEHAAT